MMALRKGGGGLGLRGTEGDFEGVVGTGVVGYRRVTDCDLISAKYN
jgi:hypothetical protein